MAGLGPNQAELDLQHSAQALCDKLGVSWLRALRVSTRKHTVAAEVRTAQNRLAVLKFCASDAFHKDSGFESERAFYAGEGFALAPALLSSGPSHVLLEFVPGITLRDWIKGEQARAELDCDALVVHLKRIAAELAATRFLPEPQLAKVSASRAAERIHNLLTSGPIDARRSRFAQSSSRQFSRISVPMLRVVLGQLHNAWVQRGVRFASRFGHNDLHTNNVLVSDSNTWVVDYERLTEPGFWYVDVLYLFGTIYSALERPEHRKRLLGAVIHCLCEQEPSAKTEFGLLARLFAAAALSNGRFRGSTWYDSRNLNSVLRLLLP